MPNYPSLLFSFLFPLDDAVENPSAFSHYCASSSSHAMTDTSRQPPSSLLSLPSSFNAINYTVCYLHHSYLSSDQWGIEGKINQLQMWVVLNLRINGHNQG